jgi:hypothetical protein
LLSSQHKKRSKASSQISSTDVSAYEWLGGDSQPAAGDHAGYIRSDHGYLVVEGPQKDALGIVHEQLQPVIPEADAAPHRSRRQLAWQLQMVKHGLSVVAFQSFLAMTLVLFFAPWFR